MKVLFVFGTRPEAIKMAPLVRLMLSMPESFETKVCVTAQHRQLLDPILDFFKIIPDYDLNLMKEQQSLNHIWCGVLLGLKEILDSWKPQYVLVHGDTATSTAAALAAFFAGCKVGHIEAGLRTWNKLAPFPEEINRQLTSRLSDVHFAPTHQAKQNLINEGIRADSVFITGNTVIDALFDALSTLEQGYRNSEIEMLEKLTESTRKNILVTGHRRENFGDGFENICQAIRDIALSDSNIRVIYPVHLNPNVQEPVNRILSGIPNIHLISPLGYPAFVWLMKHSQLIITDSGGVQEEAPSLGKPVLVMRQATERPEAVEAGTVFLVGTNRKLIFEKTTELLNSENYNAVLQRNPYGDGKACNRIIGALIQ